MSTESLILDLIEWVEANSGIVGQAARESAA